MDGTNWDIVVSNLYGVTVAVTNGEWDRTTDGIDEGIILDAIMVKKMKFLMVTS